MHKAQNKLNNIEAWQKSSLLEGYLQAPSEKEHIILKNGGILKIEVF